MRILPLVIVLASTLATSSANVAHANDLATHPSITATKQTGDLKVDSPRYQKLKAALSTAYERLRVCPTYSPDQQAICTKEAQSAIDDLSKILSTAH